MLQQRICAGILIAVSIVIVLAALQGTTPEERDITAAVFLFPLGVLLLTNAPISYIAQQEAAEKSPER